MVLPLQCLAFFWGATWASFINVVIYRVPLGLSVVRPGSSCPGCKTAIKPWDNIPILSWLILRGRCRICKISINPRYMLVELAGGVISLAIFNKAALPLDPDTLWWDLALWQYLLAFALGLIAIAFIDLEHTIVPDEITWPLTALGVGLAFVLPGVEGMQHVWGAVAGFGALATVHYAALWIFKREGMGWGDVTLTMMIGAFLGPMAIMFVLFAASIQGLVAAAISVIFKKVTGRSGGLLLTNQELDERFDEVEEHAHLDDGHKLAVPFGPFLALSALEALLLGDAWFWQMTQSLGALIYGAMPV